LAVTYLSHNVFLFLNEIHSCNKWAPYVLPHLLKVPKLLPASCIAVFYLCPDVKAFAFSAFTERASGL